MDTTEKPFTQHHARLGKVRCVVGVCTYVCVCVCVYVDYSTVRNRLC